MSVFKTKKNCQHGNADSSKATKLFKEGHSYYSKKRNGLKGAIKI